MKLINFKREDKKALQAFNFSKYSTSRSSMTFKKETNEGNLNSLTWPARRNAKAGTCQCLTYPYLVPSTSSLNTQWPHLKHNVKMYKSKQHKVKQNTSSGLGITTDKPWSYMDRTRWAECRLCWFWQTSAKNSLLEELWR